MTNRIRVSDDYASLFDNPYSEDALDVPDVEELGDDVADPDAPCLDEECNCDDLDDPVASAHEALGWRVPYDLDASLLN